MLRLADHRKRMQDGPATSCRQRWETVGAASPSVESSRNIHYAGFAARMTEVFEDDLKHTVLYTHAMWERRPLQEKLAGKFIRPLRSQL